MTGIEDRSLIRLVAERDGHAALADDVLTGLMGRPKRLPSKWLYDARGSQLFEAITAQPEYYLPEAETAILERVADEVVGAVAPAELVEIGSGSSRKTKLLLDALCRHASTATYAAFDVSETAVSEAIEDLAATYDSLRLVGVVGDFDRHLDRVPRSGTRLVAVLGSTIGNMVPSEQVELLGALREMLTDDDALLLGADLVKDQTTLEAAYNDAAGVTDAFTANLLCVLRRELDAGLEPDAFEPFARWRPEHEWMELGLRARRATSIVFPGLAFEAAFAAGEELYTEVSCKYTRASLETRLWEAGLGLHRWASDRDGRFAVVVATRA